MTLFEIIIICIVAALFVATIFVFIICIPYIKQVYRLNQQVITLTNAAYECRSFLEKLSKHDVITKINNISGLEKKIGELLSICKNQTNNITQVRDTLDKSLEDIKMRNNLIKDNHKFLDNINVKTSKMQDDINKIGEIVVDINKSVNIKKKTVELNDDYEKEVTNVNEKLEDILSWNRRCRGGIETLIDGHNKAIDAIRKSFEIINSRNDVADNAINKTYDDVKSISKDIAKISSILDQYREKVNYITTWIENATKLKTASKSKMVQSKTTTTPINKKGVQKYL